MDRLTLAAALMLGIAAPALAGPPRLTVDLLSNGRGFLVVRTFHHGTPEAIPFTGMAEGLVDGRRVSLPLTFAAGDSANIFTARKTWGDAGVWVLAFGADLGNHGKAGAVVTIARNGAPAVRYPRDATGGTRPATRAEVESMLRALDAGREPPALSTTGWLFAILRPALPIGLLLGVATLLATTLGHSVKMAARRQRETALA
jgi:hypothetical protein